MRHIYRYSFNWKKKEERCFPAFRICPAFKSLKNVGNGNNSLQKSLRNPQDELTFLRFLIMWILIALCATLVLKSYQKNLWAKQFSVSLSHKFFKKIYFSYNIRKSKQKAQNFLIWECMTNVHFIFKLTSIFKKWNKSIDTNTLR